MRIRCCWMAVVCSISVLLPGLVLADAISLQGTLALGAGAANDVFVYTFFVSAPSTVTIQSYGYGGSAQAPGGTNLAGAVIPTGGFDPYVSLFAGSGPTATFVASNDDGACPPAAPSGGLCRDSRLSLSLGPGPYTLAVTAFENMSFAENLGAGALGDGFVGLGNFDPARTSQFAVDIGGVDVISASVRPIPASSAIGMAILALLITGLGAWAQLRGHGRSTQQAGLRFRPRRPRRWRSAEAFSDRHGVMK